jgi:hypothetical protein
MQNVLLLFLCIFLCLSTIQGFQIVASQKSSIGFSSTHDYLSERDASYRLAKAQECAFSDTATPDEARRHLHQLLRIQSGCVVGTLADRDLCENQEKVAQLVLRLQAKIDQDKE